MFPKKSTPHKSGSSPRIPASLGIDIFFLQINTRPQTTWGVYLLFANICNYFVIDIFGKKDFERYSDTDQRAPADGESGVSIR